MTPYEEGYAAGRAGKCETENPYEEDRNAAAAWRGGWPDATGQDPNALEGDDE